MTSTQKKEVYASLCDQGKIRRLFMQPWWLDATGPWDVVLALRNDQVVGAMPYTYSAKWGIRKIGMPALTHHLRIWMDKPDTISDHKWLTREKVIIWLLIDDLPSYGYLSMVFEEDSFNNWLPFHWRGMKQEMRYTFVIDREAYQREDHRVSRNLRRNLREAEAQLTIRREVGIERFYHLCQETYNRQKLHIPYTLHQLQQIDHAVHQHEAGLKLAAYHSSGELIAVSWLLWDEERAYYFIAGDNDAGRTAGASMLLCQEAIRIAFEERQVQAFDFCGSMIENVVDIRRQFGARAVGLMKIWHARSKWLEAGLTLFK